MRVEFDATLDDLLDVHRRALPASRLARRWHWERSLTAALVGGAVGFLLLSGPLEARVVLAVLAGASTAVVYPSLVAWTARRRLRVLCREQVGGDGPFRVEVELCPEGVRARQLGATTTWDWDRIASIEERPDSVALAMRRGGIVVIRDRAFSSARMREDFVDLARAYLERSRPGSAG